MGPALVTADEIPDVQNLWLRTVIGDEVLQEGHTSLMIFSVAHLIADMSQVMTLEPGDIIARAPPPALARAHAASLAAAGRHCAHRDREGWRVREPGCRRGLM